MPPKSRKRNKGKDRKAKRLAKLVESERADAREIWRSVSSSIECDHGYVAIADDHPVSSFMDQCFINLQYRALNVSQNLADLFGKHTQIWNNHSYKELAIGILVRIGTNMLLDETSFWPVYIARVIVVLEHYDNSGDIKSVFNSRTVREKSRDLYNGTKSIERDVLKFYRKRATCKCLKKMHLEARQSTPKTGICWHCQKEKERVLLSVCSRCMVHQYCSRECQVAGWTNHKNDCDNLVEKQKQQWQDARFDQIERL